MSNMADLLTVDASYVTGLVDRLESMGLVARCPSEDDRRVKRLVLTDAGLELQRTIQQDLAPEQMFALLTEDEVAQFCSIIERILDHQSAG